MAENDGISLWGALPSYGVTCLATGTSRPVRARLGKIADHGQTCTRYTTVNADSRSHYACPAFSATSLASAQRVALWPFQHIQLQTVRPPRVAEAGLHEMEGTTFRQKLLYPVWGARCSSRKRSVPHMEMRTERECRRLRSESSCR